MMRLRATFFVFLLIYVNLSFAERVDDPSEMAVGDWCKYPILETHPTQFAFGKMVADEKLEKFEEFSKEELKEYLKENKVPVVRAPNGEYYMIDHHHQTVAAFKAGRENHYIKLVKNLENIPSMDAFWKEMIKNKMVWLYDENGKGPRSPRSLPRDIRKLKDDPFRSLADIVQEEGGYTKRAIPFQEFIWAQFFRQHITIESGKNGMKKALEKALKLACDPKAKNLPGYKKSCVLNLKN